MLGRQDYAREYIAHSQEEIQAQLEEMRDMPPVPTSFARRMCAHLVVVMDACFAQRLRGTDGKDGTALTEVRMLAQSIMQGDTVLDDSTVSWKPENTVLGLAPGDEIALRVDDVDRLQDAFFAEMFEKFAV
jgi:hypothetical protein